MGFKMAVLTPKPGVYCHTLATAATISTVCIKSFDELNDLLQRLSEPNFYSTQQTRPYRCYGDKQKS